MSELLNRILSRENMNQAYQKVKANKGAAGIDEVTVEELNKYIKANWVSIKEQIVSRTYRPQPVKKGKDTKKLVEEQETWESQR